MKQKSWDGWPEACRTKGLHYNSRSVPERFRNTWSGCSGSSAYGPGLNWWREHTLLWCKKTRVGNRMTCLSHGNHVRHLADTKRRMANGGKVMRNSVRSRLKSWRECCLVLIDEGLAASKVVFGKQGRWCPPVRPILHRAGEPGAPSAS